MPGATGTAATNVLRDHGTSGGNSDAAAGGGGGGGAANQQKLKRFATLSTGRRENDGDSSVRNFFRVRNARRETDGESPPVGVGPSVRATPRSSGDANESFMSPLAAFSNREDQGAGVVGASMSNLPSVRRGTAVAASGPATPRGTHARRGGNDSPAFAPPRRQRRESDEMRGSAPRAGGGPTERASGILGDRGMESRGPPPPPPIAPEHKVLPPSMDVSNTFKRALQRIATEREELKEKLREAEKDAAGVEALRASTEELRARLRVSDAAVAAERDRLAAATSAADGLRREVSHLDASLRAAQRDAATAAAEVTRKEERAAAFRDKWSAAQAALADKAREADELGAALVRARSTVAAVEADLATATGRAEKAAACATAADKRLATERERLGAATAKAAKAEEAASRRQAELDALTARLAILTSRSSPHSSSVLLLRGRSTSSTGCGDADSSITDGAASASSVTDLGGDDEAAAEIGRAHV